MERPRLMFTVLECVTMQHEHVTIVISASIALVGMLAFFHLLLRAEESAAKRRTSWTATAASAAGLSVWATHFVAMLAYRGTVPIAFDLIFTTLSALVAIVGFGIALLWRKATWRSDVTSAVIVTITVALMHLIGMLGMRAAAQIAIVWPPIAVGAIVALAMFVASFALFSRLKGRSRILIAAFCAILGICTLHFTAMSATILTPDPSLPPIEPDGHGKVWLTSAISGATLLILIVTAAAAIIDRYLVDLKGFANSTLEGLAIIRDGRIVEVNATFAALFNSCEMELVGLYPDLLLRTADGRCVQTPRATAVEAFPKSGDTSRIFELAVHTIEYRGRPCDVIAVRDLTERHRAQRKVEYLARHDVLTGLTNRSMFQERLQRQLEQTSVTGQPFALLALDLDRFKAVNDLFGHAEGDRVLKDVAEILKSASRGGDTVARLGGDEFVILTAEARHVDDAVQLADRILATFREKMNVAVDPTAVGVSIGIALFPKDGTQAESLMHAADMALYRAKASGRGTSAFYDRAMDEEMRERRQLESDLRQAIVRQELHLVFQPLLSVENKRTIGYEALIRWRHATRGDVSPNLFIPLAEDTGVILSIGEWVLREACRQASSWSPDLKVAVNVSPVQFRIANLAFVVSSILDETGLPPARLELEITETALLKDRAVTLETLKQLKAMGVQIVMDDFGTGYSSLNTLQSFPFDKIKIDRSFIAAMDTDASARAIVRAVIGLGRSLALPVTAEGIETEAQYRMIVDEGCAQAQGYLFGKPNAGPRLPSDTRRLRRQPLGILRSKPRETEV